MKITRALALRQECTDNLSGLFSHARAFCLPHSAMLDKRNNIYAKARKGPRWIVAYLDGYWQAETNQLYRDALVYGAWINDTFYSTHSKRPDYYEKQGISPSAFAKTAKQATGHFWANDVSKPFFAD